jgi:hypothetical protein
VTHQTAVFECNCLTGGKQKGRQKRGCKRLHRFALAVIHVY